MRAILPARGVDAIHRFLEIQLAPVAFIVHQGAVAGIGEPDAAVVWMHHHIVGGIERFALVTVRELR